MQHKQDDHFPWLTKMTTPTSNGVHTYSFQVRSDITTTASLKNLYSTTNIHGQPPPHHQGATHYGFIGWQNWNTEMSRWSSAGKQPARRNQRNVQGSRGRAGAYSRNLSLCTIEQEQQAGPALGRRRQCPMLDSLLQFFSMRNEKC